jgi:hypothetical protein
MIAFTSLKRDVNLPHTVGCGMRHCHICGVEIRNGGSRRIVQTGRSRREYRGKRRTSMSHSLSEGLRTVCTSCNERLDYLEAERDRKAEVWARIRLGLFCAIAALVCIAYLNRSPPSEVSASVVQGERPAQVKQIVPEPTEIDSINPPAAAIRDEPIALLAPTVPTSPSVGDRRHLLDPNFPPDALRVQDRLQSLGFSLSDPRGEWSKSTDLAVNRFRKSRGLRSDWRWDVSTEAALFAGVQ